MGSQRSCTDGGSVHLMTSMALDGLVQSGLSAAAVIVLDRDRVSRLHTNHCDLVKVDLHT